MLRTQREQVEKKRLVVADPAPRQEAFLRLPTVGQAQLICTHPVPVDALEERRGEHADLPLDGVIGVEVSGGAEGACQQTASVDTRQLRLQRALSCFHIQKVVVEAAIAGCRGSRRLVALPEEAKRGQRARRCVIAADELSFDGDGIAGEGHADGGNARRRIVAGAIGDEAVFEVSMVLDVTEGHVLDLFEQRLLVGKGQGASLRLRGWHADDLQPLFRPFNGCHIGAVGNKLDPHRGDRLCRNGDVERERVPLIVEVDRNLDCL